MKNVRKVETSFLHGEVLDRIAVNWHGEDGVEESLTLLLEGLGETKRWEGSLREVGEVLRGDGFSSINLGC